MKRELAVLFILALFASACRPLVLPTATASASSTAPVASAATPTPTLIPPTATVRTVEAAPTSEPSHPVPPQYKQQYDHLSQVLDAADARFGDLARGRKHPVIFSAELIPANSNVGAALLEPRTLEVTRLYLDRLVAMGVQGVRVTIAYPLLTPGFANSAGYLKFYKEVAQMARDRHLTFAVHASVIFANTPFTTLPVSYAGLTFDQFKGTYREHAATILRELHPDYLIIMGEPDTQAHLTGFKELNDPARLVEFIQYVLQGLDRGATKIAAGTGSWSPLTFDERIARATSVDAIGIHIYPVGEETLTRAYEAAQIAKRNGKRAIVDEMWLYKTMQPNGGSNVAATAQVFRLDGYSLWAPLDQKFIHMVANLAQATDIEFISSFWSNHFFAYLDYAPDLERATYAEFRQAVNAATFRSLQSGVLSPTGLFYRDLIASMRRN